MPTQNDLEGLTGGRPAFIFTYDAHNVWLNREALEVFGITRGTDTLAWGHVRRDPRSGEPTGIVGDFAVMGISRRGQAALEGVRARLRAVAPVRTHAREPRHGDRRSGSRRSSSRRTRRTTCGSSSARATEDRPAVAARDGRCSTRWGPPRPSVTSFAVLRAALRRRPAARRPDQALHRRRDRAVDGRDAGALREPAPASAASTFWQPDEFAELMIELERRGFQCHIHGTGDRGLRTALDAIEAARAANGPRRPPPPDGAHRVPRARGRAAVRRSSA